jgi:capsular polysaccharide biosynthesis protein
VLQRDVENAQRAYDAMAQLVNQTSVESQNKQTNVSVIKRATAPAEPSSPDLRRNLLIAVFLGTFLAVGTAILRELHDRRLRTAEDITEELGQPLLVQLPAMRLDGQSGDPSRLKLLHSRVLSGLSRPALR